MRGAPNHGAVANQLSDKSRSLISLDALDENLLKNGDLQQPHHQYKKIHSK